MTIGIHQPNFMPWYPFFKKIQSVDRFIILSHCQFEKNNFQNRFNMDDTWYTLSVKKGMSDKIVDKQYVDSKKDWNKLRFNLKKYDHILKSFDDLISDNLNDTNINIIKKLCELMNIKTEIVHDYSTDLKGDDRLIDLIKHYGGDIYLSGASGVKYMDLNKFKINNIKLEFPPDNVEKIPILKYISR